MKKREWIVLGLIGTVSIYAWITMPLPKLVSLKEASAVRGHGTVYCDQKILTISCFDWSDNQCLLIDGECIGGCSEDDYQCSGDIPSNHCFSASGQMTVKNCEYADLQCGTQRKIAFTHGCLSHYEGGVAIACSCVTQLSAVPCILEDVNYVSSEQCVEREL